MKESEFDKLVIYTLRVELFNGKVLLYRIDTENKQYLINKLQENSVGDDEIEMLRFVWFETSLSRMVIINLDSIIRITFCFDYIQNVGKDKTYYDNFKRLEKDIELEEQKTKEGEVRLHVAEDEYIPQAIIYHTGKGPDDFYDINPLTYCELSENCLSGLNLELEGDSPLRQFFNLIDNDGEETFIPFDKIIIMEFESNLVFGEEEDIEEETN